MEGSHLHKADTEIKALPTKLETNFGIIVLECGALRNANIKRDGTT
jgi:hypothetical protein